MTRILGFKLGAIALLILLLLIPLSMIGLADAAHNPALQSFLSLYEGLGQVALLLAGGIFRLWYWR